MAPKTAQQMLQRMAQMAGRSEEEVLAELVRRASDPRSEVVPANVGPPAPAAAPAPEPFQPRTGANTPTGHTVHSESDRQAYLRWFAAELGASGVFGQGGMSAGGVFGDAPVATGSYDPAAEHRAAMVRAHQAPPAPLQPQAPPQPMPVPHPGGFAMQNVRMVHYQGPSFTVYEGPGLPMMPMTPMMWPFGR